MAEKKRIFIVGTRVLGYPRNRTLAPAFGVLGEVVITELFPNIVSQLKFMWKTLRRARTEDLLVIMYPVERLPLLVILARCFFPGLVVCDLLISAYDSWVNDRALARRWGIKALYYKSLDQLACFCGDVLLFDTKEHEQYFHEHYLIRKKTRTLVSPIVIDLHEFDAISPEFPTEISRTKDRFTVLFLGNYIPLQGVQYILHAIALVPFRERFRFLMVGNGQTRPMALRLRDELGLADVEFTERLAHKPAMALMKSVDLALGIFGDTEKARRVVPNKLLEAMACRTVVVTGKSPAVEHYFRDGKEVYYCDMGNAQSLANAIFRAYEDRKNNSAISAAARSVIEREFGVPALEGRLREIVKHK